MTTLRPFLLGLLLALVLVLIALAAEGYHAGQLFWLGLLPVLALHAAAVFTPIAGYRRRLVRGALGFLAAAAVGYSTYLYLLERTDWFRNMSGWIIFIIVLHAAIPGGAAAAADSPRRGLALAGGFSVALCVAARLGGAVHPGYMLLLGVGTFVGVIVHALDRKGADAA